MLSLLFETIQSTRVPPVVRFPTSSWFSTLFKGSLPYPSLVMFYDTSTSDPIERHHDSFPSSPLAWMHLLPHRNSKLLLVPQFTRVTISHHSRTSIHLISTCSSHLPSYQYYQLWLFHPGVLFCVASSTTVFMRIYFLYHEHLQHVLCSKVATVITTIYF